MALQVELITQGSVTVRENKAAALPVIDFRSNSCDVYVSPRLFALASPPGTPASPAAAHPYRVTGRPRRQLSYEERDHGAGERHASRLLRLGGAVRTSTMFECIGSFASRRQPANTVGCGVVMIAVDQTPRMHAQQLCWHGAVRRGNGAAATFKNTLAGRAGALRPLTSGCAVASGGFSTMT